MLTAFSIQRLFLEDQSVCCLQVRLLEQPYSNSESEFNDLIHGARKFPPASAATVHVDSRLSPPWQDCVDIMSLCLSLLSLCPTVCFTRSKMPLYVSLVASILVSMETHFTNTSLVPNDPVLLLSFSLLCVEVFSFGD